MQVTRNWSNFSPEIAYEWIFIDGLVSGMKNSAAVRSAIPISHSVGPALGGSNTTFLNLILDPEWIKLIWPY